MKCLICHDDFYLNEFSDIIKVQQTCKKCGSLFIYKRKDVKMKGIIIKIYYFDYYQKIMMFNENCYSLNVNEYLIKKHLKMKKYFDIKSLEKIDCLKEQRIIRVIYYRNEYYQLLNYLAKIIKNSSKMKFLAYELLQ